MDAEPIKKLSLIFVWPKTNSRSYTFGDFLFFCLSHELKFFFVVLESDVYERKNVCSFVIFIKACIKTFIIIFVI